MTARRLPNGGRIDRSQPVRFRFDGRAYEGCAGDTLASALMANDVRVFGRSFKYHRPRGLLAAGVEEPNALVTLVEGGVREPNIPATTVEIFDGLEAWSQNRWPSLGIDVGAVNGLFGALLGAGFYYKTFMGPAMGPLRGTRFWMLCESLIRRAAGLGRAGHAPDPARYERMNAFCDVLVVGGGPAGLAAARAAAESGRRVILAEMDASLGGSANWSNETIDGASAAVWAEEAAAELAQSADVRILPRTTVWGHYDGNTLAAVERVGDGDLARPAGAPRRRHWVIRAKAVVLATGAFERPLVFPGNDRPGVMLAHAAQRYAAEWGVLPGRHMALLTNNDGAYRAALALKGFGATIGAVVDVRAEPGEAARGMAAEMGAPLMAGHGVVGTSGMGGLSAVKVAPLDAQGRQNGPARGIATDCLLVSGGWSPALHLASQMGGRPRWDDALQAFVPGEPHERWMAVGACTGTFSTAAAIAEGAAAGGGALDPLPEVKPASPDPRPAPVFEIRPQGGKGQKAFVDFQHDVTAADVRLAHREGFVSVEHLKRYTTLGMATDQGKTSGVAGMAIMAEASGRTIPDVGSTRFRPPFAPVPIGAIAAERHHDLAPERLTPMHDWHTAQGAEMLSAGLWLRPVIFGQPGETLEQAYVREARAVRERAGIVDVSTLGKIAVQGPDAGAFLDRVYANTFSTLPIMKARYGVMLREDGFLFDDGTTWRLGEHDFLMTTTTANAAKVLQHLEFFLETAWPELRVTLTSVTDQWAGAAVAGPQSRNILAACVSGAAVTNEALPFMGIVRGAIGGAPVLICRLSFSGELAFEVYSGAGHGFHVWERLIEAGKPLGAVPYGLEALGTLRIEKGHVTGSEIDGRTTAHDLHLGGMLSRKKPFVGSAMTAREGLVDPERLGLVGLVSLDGLPINGGGHIVEELDRERPRGSIGHVTAACFSPALDRYIALALVKGGDRRKGSRAFLSDPLRGRFGPVAIVSHHFFDPEGKRLHG